MLQQQKSAVQRFVSKYSNRLETRRSLIANRLKACYEKKIIVYFSFSSLPLQNIYMAFLPCKGVRVWLFFYRKKMLSVTLVFSSRTNYLFFCYKRNIKIIVYEYEYDISIRKTIYILFNIIDMSHG